MGVYKRTGKKADIWYIDYFFKGRRYQRAVGPSKKEAVAALGKIKGEIREGKFFDRSKVRDVLFEDLADEYEIIAKAKKSYHVEKHYIAKVKEYFKGRMLSNLTALDVERFKNDRKETPVRKNPQERGGGEPGTCDTSGDAEQGRPMGDDREEPGGTGEDVPRTSGP